MNLGVVAQDRSGLWRTSVWPGHADALLAAIDPSAAFVLIETWDGNLDWHEAIVSVGENDDPRMRHVRRHRFDLLLTPDEAVGVGSHLRAQGVTGGGLGCYQFRDRPHPDFCLPDDLNARAKAMRARGVQLAIDLPHDGEVAVVWSPNRTTVQSYLNRLS